MESLCEAANIAYHNYEVAMKKSCSDYESTTVTCLCPSAFYRPGPCKHQKFLREEIRKSFETVQAPPASALPLPPLKLVRSTHV